MNRFLNFKTAILHAGDLIPGSPIPNPVWQSIDVSNRPEMQMHEAEFVSFRVGTHGHEDLLHLGDDIKPNLPWADDHFAERVCGVAINPGIEWANWPGADSAATFLTHTGQFNHSYMERYWPRLGISYVATDTVDKFMRQNLGPDMEGLRHDYGDLMSLVRDLAANPMTRQAYLPIFFPEDTGDAHNGRKPCTLGYHFMMRDNKLHIVYYIRSCDYIRHFRDDIYLTMRLLLWVLDECRKINPGVWCKVVPGDFIMHISSLHMFRNDWLAREA